MTGRSRSLSLGAAAGVLGVALAAVPLTAQASTIYPPVDACQSAPASVAAGETLEFSCEAGTFGADEPVTITVTGENGAGATFGFARFAVTTGSVQRTSDANGSLPVVRVTLPSNATGVYNIAAISPTSAGGTASASITGADGLPSTGGDSAQLAGLWIGGGALVLAGAIVVIAMAVRRRRDRDEF